MRMTIDDVILCLKGIKQYGSDTFIKRSQGDWQNSLDIAIDTMRKYQDIQERIKAEMSFDNPNMDVKNLPGLTRALEIFGEVENGRT